ncbi:pentatricopeptide repeat-containing protein At1g08070, chloroplastic-like [Silene latifolia]|uniref:pentatricopeptide repeat-containing protein At1g08070, chloroplastic-like n=1 Tax=Silene latifolia TaxID=37657 RepID=UPI003D776D94
MDRQILNFLRNSLHINQLKQIHALILTNYHSISPLFVQRLINLSHTSYARKVFDEMPKRDERLYNAFITAYSKQCLYREALGLFYSMRCEITHVTNFTFPPVLKCCSALFMYGLGKQVHTLIVKCGFESNCYVQTALMDLYSKSSDLVSAKLVFDGVLDRDPIMYNCLISGYSNCGDVVAAKMLFDQMTERTLVSWNSMINCYARSGKLHEAMRMFELMQLENFQPNERSLATVLSVCANLGDLDTGLKLKKYIDDNNIWSNMIVSTALLEMFVKCGAVNEARQVFDRMKERDVITWGSMVVGYAQNGRPGEALELLEIMKRQQIKPNDVTLVSVLSACAKLGLVEIGEQIGNYIEDGGFDSSVFVATALLTMYSRCGNMKKAWQVFDRIHEKDVVCWNSMITELAFNGYAKDAINLFLEMEKLFVSTSLAGDCLNTASLAPSVQKKETNKASLKPDNVTFISLLTACTHVGLVDMGLKFFHSMRRDYNIVPQIEHYACIIDLFCRNGKLNEAHEFICQMESQPNAVIWGTLLSSCRSNSNVELAEIALKKLKEIEPDNSANYVLLSNIYADAGRWQDSLQVRNLMRGKNVQQNTACSW